MPVFNYQCRVYSIACTYNSIFIVRFVGDYQ